MSSASGSCREVERVVHGRATTDGAGVRLLRVLTPDLQRRLDPFLMLDYFHSDNPDDYIAGFPEHPHRGFETVTYMLNGRMRHRDSAGNEGLVASGGVQWMTAGRGVLHSEIPEQESGLMQGFQLWLNLPARDKMTVPWYADIPDEAIPVYTTVEGAAVKVIAGVADGHAGAVQRPGTDPWYVDVRLPARGRFAHPLDADLNAFLYVYAGSVTVGSLPQPIEAGKMAILGNRPDWQQVAVQAGATGAGLLIVAGRPLAEPIVQWGPFVMNSREQIEQAIQDYRDGVLTA